MKQDGYHYFNDPTVPLSGGRRAKTRIHTLLMGYPDISRPVDHINHNRFDNRLFNLRVCTSHQDNMNNRFHFYEDPETGLHRAVMGNVEFEATNIKSLCHLVRVYCEHIAPPFEGTEEEERETSGYYRSAEYYYTLYNLDGTPKK